MTKKRIASEISQTRRMEELALATRMRLSSAGAIDAAIIIKDITTKSPLIAAKYHASYKSKLESSLTSRRDELFTPSSIEKYDINL